jgi:hypothetical protein
VKIALGVHLEEWILQAIEDARVSVRPSAGDDSVALTLDDEGLGRRPAEASPPGPAPEARFGAWHDPLRRLATQGLHFTKGPLEVPAIRVLVPRLAHNPSMMNRANPLSQEAQGVRQLRARRRFFAWSSHQAPKIWRFSPLGRGTAIALS